MFGAGGEMASFRSSAFQERAIGLIHGAAATASKQAEAAATEHHLSIMRSPPPQHAQTPTRSASPSAHAFGFGSPQTPTNAVPTSPHVNGSGGGGGVNYHANALSSQGVLVRSLFPNALTANAQASAAAALSAEAITNAIKIATAPPPPPNGERTDTPPNGGNPRLTPTPTPHRRTGRAGAIAKLAAEKEAKERAEKEAAAKEAAAKATAAILGSAAAIRAAASPIAAAVIDTGYQSPRAVFTSPKPNGVVLQPVASPPPPIGIAVSGRPSVAHHNSSPGNKRPPHLTPITSPGGDASSNPTANSAARFAATIAGLKEGNKKGGSKHRGKSQSPPPPQQRAPEYHPTQIEARIAAEQAAAQAAAIAQAAADDLNFALFTHEAMLKRKLLRNHREIVRVRISTCLDPLLTPRSSLPAFVVLMQELNRFWAIIEKEVPHSAMTVATAAGRHAAATALPQPFPNRLRPSATVSADGVISVDPTQLVANRSGGHGGAGGRVIGSGGGGGSASGAGLAKDEYVRVHMRLSRALNPKFNYRAAALLADLDWNHDSRGQQLTTLDYQSFLDFLFELADLWCVTVDARDYVTFLQQLFTRVTSSSADGEYVFRPIQRIEPLPIAIEREHRREQELIKQEREIRFQMKDKLHKHNAAVMRRRGDAAYNDLRPVLDRLPSPPPRAYPHTPHTSHRSSRSISL